MLFRAVHQERQRKSFGGLLFTGFLDDAAGNRFYQYDMEQAKTGLLKKATFVKTSMKQWGSAACIETDEKKEECHLN
jgi:hypothetical protein